MTNNVEKEQAVALDVFSTNKAQDYEALLSLIQTTEADLADLRLRQQLSEADFPTLVEQYNELIVSHALISTVAKASLLQYLTYELLSPLQAIHLTLTDAYQTWTTSHFDVKYTIDQQQRLCFHFKLNPVNQRFETAFLPLLTLDLTNMTATVVDDQVLHIIRLWDSEQVFSRNQLSLFNYDINQVLAHFKTLGFTVSPSLFDDTQSLHVQLENDFVVQPAVLDEIFITTMENDEYDFEKIDAHVYEVQLDFEQTIQIFLTETQTKLQVDGKQQRRSLLDFFTSYPFLVPLITKQ